jgi:hypothetical protein
MPADYGSPYSIPSIGAGHGVYRRKLQTRMCIERSADLYSHGGVGDTDFEAPRVLSQQAPTLRRNYGCRSTPRIQFRQYGLYVALHRSQAHVKPARDDFVAQPLH